MQERNKQILMNINCLLFFHTHFSRCIQGVPKKADAIEFACIATLRVRLFYLSAVESPKNTCYFSTFNVQDYSKGKMNRKLSSTACYLVANAIISFVHAPTVQA